MEYWHLMLSSEERATLFPDEARLRAGVRAVVKVAPNDQVAFNLVDSHIHQVVIGSRKRVGRLAQATILALRPLVAVPLSPARIKPVSSRSHLEKLLSYVLRQDRGHATNRHPALATGSCFQDLAGVRVLPGLELRIKDALPRYQLRQAYLDVGLPTVPLEPADDRVVRSLGAERLVEAAAAACCVGPSLAGRTTRSVSAARRAAASIARKAGIGASEVAELLQVGTRSVRALASSVGDEVIESAVRKRLALEERASECPSMVRESPAPWWSDEDGDELGAVYYETLD